MNNQTLEILLKARDEASKVLASIQKTTKQLADDTSRFAVKARADTNALFSSWAGHNVELTKGQERLQQSLGATAKAIGILGGAAVAGGAALVALGKRGSDVVGVEGAFRALSKAAKQNADEMLAASRASTRGLVADYDLMAAANKALLLGLPVTSKEMGVLGQVAVTLGQAMRVGPTQAMDDLITGLGRGSAQILDNLGITVNATEAQQSYADSIGKSFEQLTAAEQRTAVYNAAITAAQGKLAEMGETQLSFGLRLTQVTTQLQNFIDNLGKAVATSPAVNTALKTMADGMTKAFADSSGTVKALMGVVDAFAVGIVKAASYAVSAAGFIGQAWNGLGFAFNATMAGIADQVGKVITDLEKLTAPFTKMSAVQAAFLGPMAQHMRELGLALSGSSKTVAAWGDGFRKNAADALTATGKLDNTVRTTTQALDKLALTMSEAAKQGAKPLAEALGGGSGSGGSGAGGGVVEKLKETAQWARIAGQEMFLFIEKTRDFNYASGPLRPQSRTPSQDFKGGFDLTAGGGAAFATSIRDNIAAAFKTLPQAIMGALQGGGNVAKSIGSLFGSSIFGEGSKLVTGLTSKLTGTLGKTLGGALGSVIPGLGTMLGGAVGGLFGKLFGGDQTKKQLLELRQQLMDLGGGSMDALRKKAASLGIDISKAFTTKSPKELQATIEKLNKAMEEQKKKLEALSIAAQGFVGLAQEWGKQIAESGATEEMQAQFDRLGLYATAIFAGIVRETGDVIGAFKQIGEGLSEMRKRQEEFGLKASETTQKLLDLYGIVENNEGAANALSFLNQMMTGLVDAGMKSQALFTAFGADATKIFNDLVAGGATSNQALALMQPTLQRLWEMHNDLGYEVDENTKKLLDQAEEQGLVGDNMRSVNDKILQVLLAIGEALGATIPDALRRTGDAAEREFGRFRDAARDAGDSMPGGGHAPNRDWDAGRDYGLGGMATGGRVPYTPGGKAIRVGEQETESILTDGQLAGIMKRAGVSGGGMPSSLSINLNVDGVQLGTYVVKLTNEGLADGRVRVPTRAIAERNG